MFAHHAHFVFDINIAKREVNTPTTVGILPLLDGVIYIGHHQMYRLPIIFDDAMNSEISDHVRASFLLSYIHAWWNAPLHALFRPTQSTQKC